MNKNQEPKLLDLARKEFKDLNSAEEKLFRSIGNSEPADYTTEPKKDDNPKNASSWGEDRTLKADRIQWLCRDPKVSKLYLPKGVNILGAKIEGSLNLSFTKVEIPLSFIQCSFREPLYLEQAELKSLALSGTYIASTKIRIISSEPPIATSINAPKINVVGSVLLNDAFHASGAVNLYGATINGSLICSEGSFTNEGEYALFAQSIKVGDSVLLNDGFHASGKVNLYGATIGGSFICSQGSFTNKDGYALFAQSIKVGDSVLLKDGFKALGKVNLYGATIGRDLICSEGSFTNQGKNKDALFANSINVTGSVLLKDGFKALGKVSLYSATNRGKPDSTAKTSDEDKKDALIAEFVNVTGSVVLDEIKAFGKFSLYSATIGGDIKCESGRFENEGRDALMAEFVDVKGSILLINCKTFGKINLYGATIGNNLDCVDGTFTNENKDALFAESINVKGSVFISEFKVSGNVSFSDAKIEKRLQIKQIEKLKEMVVDLQFAKVQTLELEDAANTLPSVKLNGLVFEAIGEKFEAKFKEYLKWLRRQSQSIPPQYYEQLAKVLRTSGKGSEATRVLIAKEDNQRRHGNLNLLSKFRKQFLSITIRYGYRPENAFRFGLGVVAFGFFMFWWGYQNGLITPTEKDCKPPSSQQQKEYCSNYPYYPKFDPFIYSLDIFLPIIDLRLKNYWLPNANVEDKYIFFFKSGELLRYYLLFHILLGWILTTLWLASLSGIVRSNNSSNNK